MHLACLRSYLKSQIWEINQYLAQEINIGMTNTSKIPERLFFFFFFPFSKIKYGQSHSQSVLSKTYSLLFYAGSGQKGGGLCSALQIDLKSLTKSD